MNHNAEIISMGTERYRDPACDRGSVTMTDEQRTALISAAQSVRRNAYAPYSNYYVGAAIMAKSGKIYTGANFENAAFGAGTCAERVALGSALSAGEREFEAICVCGQDSDITPCGICRQALWEFGDIAVICCDESGNAYDYTLKELLPGGFRM